MAFGRVNSSGGIRIEGIKKSFKVATGQAIKKGQFIKINDTVEFTPSELINNGMTSIVKSVQIAPNVILMIWVITTSASTNGYMYARLFGVSQDKKSVIKEGFIGTTNIVSEVVTSVAVNKVRNNCGLITYTTANGEMWSMLLAIEENAFRIIANTKLTTYRSGSIFVNFLKGTMYKYCFIDLTTNKLTIMFVDIADDVFNIIRTFKDPGTFLTCEGVIQVTETRWLIVAQGNVYPNKPTFLLYNIYDSNVVYITSSFFIAEKVNNMSFINKGNGTILVFYHLYNAGTANQGAYYVVKYNIVDSTINKEAPILLADSSQYSDAIDIGNGRILTTAFVVGNGGYIKLMILKTDRDITLYESHTLTQYDITYTTLAKGEEYCMYLYALTATEKKFVNGQIIDTLVTLTRSNSYNTINGVALENGVANQIIKVSTL